MKFGSAIVKKKKKSTRMGFDKQTIEVGNELLVARIIRALARDFQEIIVVTGEPALYRAMPVKVTKDLLPSRGPLTGIHAGLSLIASDYGFVIACDMPHYNAAYAAWMKEALTPDSPGILTAHENGWIEPFHAFYHKKLAGPIEQALSDGVRKIRQVTDRAGVQSVPMDAARRFSPTLLMFQNINTREELAAFMEAQRDSD